MYGILLANILDDPLGGKEETPLGQPSSRVPPLLSEATKTKQAGQMYLQVSYFKTLSEGKFSPEIPTSLKCLASCLGLFYGAEIRYAGQFLNLATSS